MSTGRQTDRLGISTAADTVNRLFVKSDAELLSHDDVTLGAGAARKVINHTVADNAAFVVFRAGFSGQTEFALIGGGHLRLKWSVDGSYFFDCILDDTETGWTGSGAEQKGRVFISGSNLVDYARGDLHTEKAGYYGLAFLCTLPAQPHLSPSSASCGARQVRRPRSKLAGC